MFLLDDLLMAPMRGLMFVMREIAKVADEEREADERSVMAELIALHRSMDNGELSEADFDVQEATLLERLDGLRGQDSADDEAGAHGP